MPRSTGDALLIKSRASYGPITVTAIDAAEVSPSLFPPNRAMSEGATYSKPNSFQIKMEKEGVCDRHTESNEGLHLALHSWSHRGRGCHSVKLLAHFDSVMDTS